MEREWRAGAGRWARGNRGHASGATTGRAPEPWSGKTQSRGAPSHPKRAARPLLAVAAGCPAKLWSSPDVDCNLRLDNETPATQPPMAKRGLSRSPPPQDERQCLMRSSGFA
jgi:hypothetical protein